MNEQHNGQKKKYKRTNNNLQNIHKTSPLFIKVSVPSQSTVGGHVYMCVRGINFPLFLRFCNWILELFWLCCILCFLFYFILLRKFTISSIWMCHHFIHLNVSCSNMSMIIILFVVTTICRVELNAERIFDVPVRESYDYVIGTLKHTVSHVLFGVWWEYIGFNKRSFLLQFFLNNTSNATFQTIKYQKL